MSEHPVTAIYPWTSPLEGVKSCEHYVDDSTDIWTITEEVPRREALRRLRGRRERNILKRAPHIVVLTLLDPDVIMQWRQIADEPRATSRP